MRLLTSASLSLSLAVAASAQNITFLTSLAEQLSALGLTSLVSAVTSLNSTATGQSVLAQLGNSTQTIFAPNNAGFTGIHPNISSNPDLLANVLSYHVVPGSFNVTQSFPNTTVGRTLLNHNSSLVFLEGDKNQVLAWSDINGTVRILNQNTEVSVVNSTTFENLTIHVVDAVIDVPGELTAALAGNNLTSFQTALTQANFLDTLNFAHGITVFAPTDEAFAAVQQNLTAASSNSSVLDTILRNHVINGTSVYSGNLQGGTSATSAAGEKISATFNSTGAFVTSGNTTAQIVTPDVLLWNGVLHIVDHVFLNEDEDSGAASSAASSASSAATAATTQTGPIGFTPSPTSTSASGSGGSGSSSSAAGRAAEFPLRSIGLAALVGTLGVLAGGFLAL
ncbi:Fasciclin-domain-containing protein [Schizopora paradoxa]|uniref:Fasciclin-domain-containing protein n=1 Tax=Schizopora paradoxa TaxID=27342 RepID=A0A0H2S0I1_9AGAM|nr:Fasciclin-domain-containing protein [Schizopora paradoxa]